MHSDIDYSKGFESQYLDILKAVLARDTASEDRTGVGTLILPGSHTITHDMSLGFPLLTTKKVHYPAVITEAIGFLNGIIDKQWYKDRKCRIWNEWANPVAVRNYMEANALARTPENIKQAQETCNDLGPVYGYLWRHWGKYPVVKGQEDQGLDQIAVVLNSLHAKPTDRRMVVSSWDPSLMAYQALPACHLLWNVQCTEGRLNLTWYQRSADFFLGVPFNIASYAFILELLCNVTGYKPGILTGHFMDTHIYLNQIEQVREQVSRPIKECTPRLQITSAVDPNLLVDYGTFTYEVEGYVSHPAIKAAVAV